jgi:8-oxo-dGTP pyrophosphatase MutT (NUDIX family)
VNKSNLPFLKDGKAGTIPFVIENGRLLMMFMVTSDPMFGGALPMIAKGHVDENELVMAAAIREAEEELGLKRTNMKEKPFVAWDGQLGGMDDFYNFTVLAVEVKDKNDFDSFHFETASTHWLTAEEFAAGGRTSQNHIVQEAAQKILARRSL